MDKKYKILCIPSDREGGVGKYRSVDPHKYIQEHYGDEFDVDIVYDMPHGDLQEFLKQYDLVQFHKQLDKNGDVLNMLNFLGIPTVVDIDDHYDLGNDHPMSLTAKKEKWHEPIIKHLKNATCVTTTTPIFAKILKKHNKNVVVLPNAIDPTEPQFAVPKNPPTDDRLRVGIICGSTHLKDLKLMDGIAKLVDLNKVQFILCGFDTNGTRTIYHQDTGEVERRPIYPEESVWCDYERIFTDNYKTISKEHHDFLLKYQKDTDDPFINEPYRRMWTRKIDKYATHYANIDVLLAPLKENDFDLVKSQLKVIECAFTNTAFIGQNFGAYTIDIVPMITKGGVINENGNGLLVDTAKNHKLWAKYVNKLADDRDMLHKLQANLHDSICPKYSLEAVTAKRVELYKKLIEENKAN